MQPDQQKKSNDIDNGAIFMALLLVLSYALSLAAREHWALDLFRHFMHQYLIGSLILTPFLLWKKKTLLASLTALVGIMSFYEISSRFDRAPPAQDTAQTIKVIHYNRRWTLRDHENMKAWLIKENPDIFVIQEAIDSHGQTLNDLKSLYPYQIHETRRNAFGLILASKHPFIESQTHENKRYALDNFYVHAVVELPGDKKLSIYTAHPPPPTNALLQTQRNEDIKEVIKAIQSDSEENIIFMGDWNITVYSPYFDDVLKETGLKNQYSSLYPFPTWPSPFILQAFQIPIDHILFKGNISLIKRERGPSMGSDHYPVIAEFYFLKPDEHGTDQ